MQFLVEITERCQYVVTVPDDAERPADLAEEMARDGKGTLISRDREWTNTVEPIEQED